MRNKSVLYITQAAIIAALYVALTGVSALLGLASGTIQVRISEALCILPVFTPAAIPGLWIGCMIANVFFGGTILDVIFGGLATLVAAFITYLLRGKKCKFWCTWPPVIANAIVVPLILIYGYHIPPVVWKGMNITWVFSTVTVAIGEVIAACILGTILLKVLGKYRTTLFNDL